MIHVDLLPDFIAVDSIVCYFGGMYFTVYKYNNNAVSYPGHVFLFNMLLEICITIFQYFVQLFTYIFVSRQSMTTFKDKFVMGYAVYTYFDFWDKYLSADTVSLFLNDKYTHIHTHTHVTAIMNYNSGYIIIS